MNGAMIVRCDGLYFLYSLSLGLFFNLSRNILDEETCLMQEI